MNKPAVSQEQMRRATLALEAAGHSVGGVRLHLDCSVSILTTASEGSAAAAPPAEAGGWEEYDAQHRDQ